MEEGWEGGGYSGGRREVGGGVRGEVVLGCTLSGSVGAPLGSNCRRPIMVMVVSSVIMVVEMVVIWAGGLREFTTGFVTFIVISTLTLVTLVITALVKANLAQTVKTPALVILVTGVSLAATAVRVGQCDWRCTHSRQVTMGNCRLVECFNPCSLFPITRPKTLSGRRKRIGMGLRRNKGRREGNNAQQQWLP